MPNRVVRLHFWRRRTSLVCLPLLTQQALFATISLLPNGGAYPEWLRGQALGSHSNLVQSPRC
jgi:hypothetical protein